MTKDLGYTQAKGEWLLSLISLGTLRLKHIFLTDKKGDQTQPQSNTTSEKVKWNWGKSTVKRFLIKTPILLFKTQNYRNLVNFPAQIFRGYKFRGF